jgi:hypothetical protein
VESSTDALASLVKSLLSRLSKKKTKILITDAVGLQGIKLDEKVE